MENAPCGQTGPQFKVPEHAEDAPRDACSGPLEQRLGAKAPGDRRAAYQELQKLLQDGADVCAEEYAHHVVPMLKDSAPANHESALAAGIAFVQCAPASVVQPMAAACAGALVENEKYVAGRNQSKTIELLTAMNTAGTGVEASLTKALTHKKPKVCAGAAKALAHALQSGKGPGDRKMLGGPISSLLTHRDEAVRGEGRGVASWGGIVHAIGARGPSHEEPFQVAHLPSG